LTASMLHLDRPSSYPFELLEPIFTGHLGLTSAAWVDAWEKAELTRMASGLSKEHPAEVEEAVAKVDRAAKLNAEAALPAKQDVVKSLAHHVRVSTAHIRVRDTSFDDLYWPVTGLRLLDEVRRGGDAHPIVRAKLFAEDALATGLVLEAVNLRIAQRGNDIAWRSASSSGPGMATIPDDIWLDTAETPERDI